MSSEEIGLLSQNVVRNRRNKVYTFEALFRKQQVEPPKGICSSFFQKVKTRSDTLKRTLGVWDLITYGISSTLGTGFFLSLIILINLRNPCDCWISCA